MSQQLPPNVPQAAVHAAGADVNAVPLSPNGVGKGPGEGNVGVFGIIALIVYLVLFTILLIIGLVKVWPTPTPARVAVDETAGASAPPTASPVVSLSPAPASPTASQSPALTPTSTSSPTPKPSIAAGQASASPKPSASPAATPIQEPVTVDFFGWQGKLWDEQRLLLLVILAGALGSILHDLRSVYWYVGNRNLVWSWMAMFFVLPFAGATLALIFYLVVRGGFFSPQSSFKETSPFGFAAFSALIGMFSPQAVLKLKEVAETLLTKPGPGSNAQPQATAHPSSPPPPPSGGAANK